MELAMPVGDSGGGSVVCGQHRSEGLSGRNSALPLLHFSVGCVNECSNRVTRPGERWPSSGGVIDSGDRLGSDRGVAVRALSGWPLWRMSGEGE